jgi:hypothetical protein
MVRLFYRRYAPAFWDRNALEGPCKGLTLREWEVSVILCSLPLAIRQMLLAWLIAPTDPRWPAPDSFSRQRSPFAPGDLRQPPKPLPVLLVEEIKAILQTLDMPLESLHGITRDLLLVAHGTRLRQLCGALGERLARQEIEAVLRVASQTRPRLPAYLSKRWGGRWAWYFSGAPAL